jgi:hypothetical protein
MLGNGTTAAANRGRAGNGSAGQALHSGPRRTDQGDSRPRLRLLSFKAIVKGSLRGFASVELPIGLRIADVPVCISNGKAWATLSSKPQIDSEGRHRRDVNGKPAYTAILEWRDKALRDRFSSAVVELVRAQYPGALDGAS